MFVRMTCCLVEQRLTCHKALLRKPTIHVSEFVQKIVDSFWKRWTPLIPRKKWNAEKRNVQVDDFVIVQTPNAVRGNWNNGRFVNVYPGQDGKVRNVRVKTGTGEYDRPVTKIVVVQPADGYE